MSKMFPWCKIKCIQLMITAVLSVFFEDKFAADAFGLSIIVASYY